MYKNTNNYLKWLLVCLAIFFIFIIIPIGGWNWFENKYQNSYYPGIHLGGTDLSGMSKDRAKSIINTKIDKLNQDGIIFEYNNNQSTFLPLVFALESDLAYQLIDFEIDKTLSKLLSYGREDNFVNNIKNKFLLIKNKPSFPISFTINEAKVYEFLYNNFSSYSHEAQNAKLEFIPATYTTPIKFSISPEKIGQVLDYKKAVEKLKNNISFLNSKTIEINVKIDYPTIYKKDTVLSINSAEKILTQAPFYLNNRYNEYYISQRQLAEWLSLENSISTSTQESTVIVSLDKEKIDFYLNDLIAPKVNKEPVDAKLEVRNGRVVEFQLARDGIEINNNQTYLKLIEELIYKNSKYPKIEIVTTELKSKIKTGDVNDLGIKEIIGTGHSNFAGSPSNRRHNIAVGAAAVNGTLLKPGGEFSLNYTLGEVDKESGYLPELVIKDNSTVPEYGGGLCQIGTTLFRGTLSSGLPVTMRRNHSYRVSYYEPAGTDATIYSPWPDYKFKNDTPHHILIQSRINGDNIYFDFWGTEDGRKATTTYPIIYKIVKPEPTKIIETLDLPPGEKKCTEHAHNGADAWFDYTVIYPDNEEKKETFYSHYVPWREVCLLGVEELSKDINATSTEEISQ